MLDWRALREDLADLVLARTCAGCESPGTVLCSACWSALTRGLVDHELPDGTHALAGMQYRGIGKSVVLAHKEHGWNALTPMLGILLARAITAVTESPVALVPIPPHADSLARRGTDPLADIVDAAIRSLRAIGQPAARVPMLHRARDQGSLKVLGRQARREAVAFSFTVSPRRTRVRGSIVIVDDVITTGTTCAEARRALEFVGLSICGTAAVASTPLRAGLR